MDLNLFSSMLKELLSTNDGVSVPGLGRFFSEDVPACFSDRGYTINPPYRRLCFRINGAEDGLLVKLYRESNPGLSEKEALRAISDFVSGLKNNLFSSKTVILPGLGRLRATRENNIFLVQDENISLFPQYDFLEPVSLRNRAEVTVNVRNTESAEAPVQERVYDRPPKRHPALTVILVLLIVSAVFLGSLAFLGRYCPEIIDQYLYTPEQLSVIYDHSV